MPLIVVVVIVVVVIVVVVIVVVVIVVVVIVVVVIVVFVIVVFVIVAGVVATVVVVAAWSSRRRHPRTDRSASRFPSMRPNTGPILSNVRRYPSVRSQVFVRIGLESDLRPNCAGQA